MAKGLLEPFFLLSILLGVLLVSATTEARHLQGGVGRSGGHKEPFNLLMAIPTLNAGEIKDSGPSPGAGHGSGLLGGMKRSGPSHSFNYKLLIGGIKDSGPSPGAGNAHTTTLKQ